jgi:3-oxoacyl-[acyl-carrier protein] reductase
MDLGITGRTAVVCASTSGLSEAIARALAADCR